MKKNGAVESFFVLKIDIDIAKEYDRLENIGKIPANSLRDRDMLLSVLNDAQDNARRADTIHLKARNMYEMFLVEYNQKIHELKQKALVRTKAWMDRTGTKKQITQDMVIEAICAQDDTRTAYGRLVAKELGMRTIRDMCRILAEKWDGRRFLLVAQAQLLRAIVEVDLGEKDTRRKYRE